MQLVLDSADVAEVRHAIENWGLDGVTTNPRHIRASGKPFRAVIQEIAELVVGTPVPVSVEVNPHLNDWRAIVAEGVELSAISPNFVVKVGAGEAGFKAIRELSAAGVRTNATLIFSVAQAWHAARSGATYLSPFLAWKEAHGDDPKRLISEIVTMLSRQGYRSQVIAAAVRNARQIGAAALAGAHAVTAGFDVWRDSFTSPYTDHGHNVFRAAWDATPQD